MDIASPADQEQAKLWNGPAGRAWVQAQQVLDGMFQPLEDRLLEAVAAAAPRQVLDVGCGTGSTTLAVARLLGKGSQCMGIDISEPMIRLALARAGQQGSAASFVRADAQTHAFAPAAFDMIVSRLGVMFFGDPVRAFANLREAARPQAALRFIAWRGAAENPFMTAAERAAAPLLPELPARRPGAPGQFAFAEESRMRRILQDSGWTAVDVQPIDVACSLPEKELLHYLSLLGPVGLALQHVDEATRRRVLGTVRAAFDPYVHGTDVRFTAACWIVGARSHG